MNRSWVARSVASLLVACVLQVVTSRIEAAPHVYPTLTPGGALALGFQYQLIPGYGYRVAWPLPSGVGSNIGLEPGDVVLAINGHSLNFYNAHVMALAQGSSYHNWHWFTIRDVRTGNVVYRWAYAPVSPF